MVFIRLIIIGILSIIELVLVYLVSIELVLVLLVYIELVVWVVFVKLVSGILERVFFVFYINICALILRLLCPRFMKTFTFIKLTGTIQRKIVGLIMILLTICITTTKSDWVMTNIIEI